MLCHVHSILISVDLRVRNRLATSLHAMFVFAAGVSSLDAAIVALELLGWADVEGDKDALVPLLCTCLRALSAVAAAPPTPPAANNAAADSAAAAMASDDELDTGDSAAK